MKRSLRIISRILVVGLATTLIPVRVWAMEEVQNHVLKSLQRVAPRYPNIDAEIVGLLNQYESDDQIINALRPLAAMPGAAEYFNVSRIDEIRAMQGEKLDGEVFQLLKPLNDALGKWGIGSIAKSFLMSHLRNGLPGAEERAAREKERAENERREKDIQIARENEQALREQEEEVQRKKEEAEARMKALDDEAVKKQKENEDQNAFLQEQLRKLRAGILSKAAVVEHVQPSQPAAHPAPTHQMVEESVVEDEVASDVIILPQEEPVQPLPQPQHEEFVQVQPQNSSQDFEDEDSEDDIDALIARAQQEQNAARAQAEGPQEVDQSDVQSFEQVRLNQDPARVEVNQPVQNAANEEEIARLERLLEENSRQQAQERARIEAERNAQRQAEQEAERQAQELERQRQEAELRRQQAEREQQQAQTAQQERRAQAANTPNQQGLFDGGLFGVLNNVWSWIKGNPVKSAIAALGLAFGLYKLISNLFGDDEAEEVEPAQQPADGVIEPETRVKQRRPKVKSKQSTKKLSPKDAEKARLQNLKRKRAQLRRAFLKNRGTSCKARCSGRR